MTGIKKYHLIAISIIGGILLSIAWPERGFAPLLFIGFIPFIFLEDHILQNREKFNWLSVFKYSYPGFLLWNVLTTWWIWNSTDFGAILAWLLNTFFMAATLTIFHLVRRATPSRSPLLLIFFWISFEYWHHNWEGTWPWISLGNGFAGWHHWVQWYEYTGIFGGTLWILLVNILLYLSLKRWINKEKIFKASLPAAIALLLSFLTVLQSYSLYRNHQETRHPVDVVVVQPNMDPYEEQFELPAAEVLQINLDLALQELDSNVDYIVSPESAIQEGIWEERIEESPSVRTLRQFTRDNPDVAYVIGASTYKRFAPGEKLSATARKFRSSEGHYDAFNTALYFENGGTPSLHHKSKLTPGVEKMPFSRLMKPLENLAFNLGGTVGSLGVDPERTVFAREEDSLKIAPVICYESVFGEYVTDYIHKGAQLIFVITNDGWWGDTPGHRQHLTFSKLRAIETRRSIARSANTGISCFIDQRGDIFQATKYWEPAVIRQTLNANDEITVYVKYGDYIARLSAFTAVFLILIAISIRLRKK